MSQPSPDQSEILLSIADLERAAAEGVLSYAEVREIAAWADKQSLPRSPLIKAPAEHRKGLNLVTVIYYFGALLMILGVSMLPFLALPFVHGWTLALVLLSIMIAMGFHSGTAWVMRASPLYALTHPVGAAIFSYMLLRSTVVTLVQGGIIWRGTFYPLDELRRGIV